MYKYIYKPTLKLQIRLRHFTLKRHAIAVMHVLLVGNQNTQMVLCFFLSSRYQAHGIDKINLHLFISQSFTRFYKSKILGIKIAIANQKLLIKELFTKFMKKKTQLS